MCLVNCTEIKKGFTLAEVLVTLAIIGVVAALTIPALINNTSDKQLMVMWKKQFSVASQAVKRLEAEKGSIDFTDGLTVREDFETVMNFAKKDQWKNISSDYYNYYKNSSEGRSYANFCYRSAKQVDGSVWCFGAISATCNDTFTGLTGICGQIQIDVNGAKSPNMYGKDLFFLWIAKKNGSYVIYPFGSNGDGYKCIAGWPDTATGTGCSQKALLSKSPDDMP